MVIFVVTKEGFRELEEVIKTGLHPVWIGCNVLTKPELQNYRKIGLDITGFSYEIDPSNHECMERALETISEHHPGERIWLEYLSKV